MRRTLTLKKETLTELSPHELRAVVGGQSDDCVDPPSNVCMETYQALCLVSRVMAQCVVTEPSVGGC